MGSACSLPAGKILVALGRLDAGNFDAASWRCHGTYFSSAFCLGGPASGDGRGASPLARTGWFHVSVSATLGGFPAYVRAPHLPRKKETGHAEGLQRICNA